MTSTVFFPPEFIGSKLSAAFLPLFSRTKDITMVGTTMCELKTRWIVELIGIVFFFLIILFNVKMCKAV